LTALRAVHAVHLRELLQIALIELLIAEHAHLAAELTAATERIRAAQPAQTALHSSGSR
jgi:hypothetical protein